MVVEVNWPDRRQRRSLGKIRARTAAINELRALLVTAPAELREPMAGRSAETLTAACARLRPATDLTDPLQATKLALHSLARRCKALTAEIEDLDVHLTSLVTQARPDLLSVHGVGPRDRRPAADRLRRQPRPAHLPGSLRRPLRRRNAPGI